MDVFCYFTSTVSLAGVRVKARRSSSADHVSRDGAIFSVANTVGHPYNSSNFEVRRLRAIGCYCSPPADGQSRSYKGLADIWRQASDADGAGDRGWRDKLEKREIVVHGIRVIARMVLDGFHVDVYFAVCCL